MKELVEEYQNSGDLTEEKETLIKSTAAIMYVGKLVCMSCVMKWERT